MKRRRFSVLIKLHDDKNQSNPNSRGANYFPYSTDDVPIHVFGPPAA